MVDKKELATKLIAVTKELDKLEVKGVENMKVLLTCIAYLQGMAEGLNKDDEEETAE